MHVQILLNKFLTECDKIVLYILIYFIKYYGFYKANLVSDYPMISPHYNPFCCFRPKRSKSSGVRNSIRVKSTTEIAIRFDV